MNEIKSVLKIFILGLVAGVLSMIPVLLEIRKPIIEAILVPDTPQFRTERYTVIMRNVPNYLAGKRDLVIHVAPLPEVQKKYWSEDPDDKTEVMGYYNPMTHEIWTVNDPQVILHEIRHVFEGGYHR